MGLMDSIGRGVSAAAYAGADLYARGALADQQAAIQLERDKRLEEAGIRAEDRGLTNRATERETIFNENVTNAPTLRGIKVEDYKATKKAEYDPEIQALQTKAKTEALTAEEQAKLDFYNNNKTGLINQKREMARAGHIDDGAALRAVQVEAANLTLSEKKEINKLIKEADETTDPKRKAQIMQSLANRGVLKNGEFDTEKVVTEKMNPDGTTTKTEHTQKRRGGGQKEDVSGSNVYDQARAAIASGASLDAVNKRLIANGLEPLPVAAKAEKQSTRAPSTTTKSGLEPTGEIAYSRDPMSGSEVYTVDGVRGRFKTRAEAEAAKRKSGIGLSDMSKAINRYED